MVNLYIVITFAIILLLSFIRTLLILKLQTIYSFKNKKASDYDLDHSIIAILRIVIHNQKRNSKHCR